MVAPWTRHYDPEVPPSLAPYPAKTLVDYIRETADARPDAPAIFFKGTTLSNGDLDRLSDRFAAALVGAGIRKGSRVALVLPNCPQFLIAEIGAWKAGATVLPLNPLYTAGELREPLAAAGIELVVTLTPFYTRLKEIQRETGVKRIVATNIKEYLPALLRVLFTLLKEKKAGHRITLEPGDLWFQDCLKDHASAVRDRQSRTIARRSRNHADERWNDRDAEGRGRAASMPRCGGNAVEDVAASPGISRAKRRGGLPGHYGGRPSAVPCVRVRRHSESCHHRPNSDGARTRTLVTSTTCSRPSRAIGPRSSARCPRSSSRLLNHPKVKAKAVDFSPIRTCFSGAAPLMAATKTQFEALTGGRIVEGYSLTEAMMACIVNPLNGINKLGSVGVPLPDVEVAIVDPESGTRFLPNGETGEIILRAPQLMAGYFNDTEETARTLRVHPDSPTSIGTGPWLHTGDLGYLDADSFLFIVDRQKDLIKTSGYQVWPREIEEVLAAHPCVQEVGVAGVPDEVKGEVVKAWVVKRAGTNPTLEELRAYCKQNLAPYKTPAHVEFRDSLPKTMAGKVLRRALVAEHKASTDTSTSR